MKYALIIYVFVVVFILSITAVRYLTSKQQIRERLDYLEIATASDRSSRRPARGIYAVIQRCSAYFEDLPWAKKMEDLLVQAGLPWRGAEFVVISLAVAIVTALLLLFITHGKLFISLAGGLLAFFLPMLVVRHKLRKKQALLNGQLPVALGLMANALRSGYSYMQAMDLVAKEVPYPLGNEFAVVLQEMNLGISIEDALQNLVKRNNTADLDLTVTAFLIQRQVGGNLAELVDSIAETLRERVKMRGKIKTLTAQGKVSGIILCLLPIFIGLAIFCLNRDYLLNFLANPKGPMLLAFGLVFQIAGVVWMRKIINIEM